MAPRSAKGYKAPKKVTVKREDQPSTGQQGHSRALSLIEATHQAQGGPQDEHPAHTPSPEAGGTRPSPEEPRPGTRTPGTTATRGNPQLQNHQDGASESHQDPREREMEPETEDFIEMLGNLLRNKVYGSLLKIIGNTTRREGKQEICEENISSLKASLNALRQLIFNSSSGNSHSSASSREQTPAAARKQTRGVVQTKTDQPSEEPSRELVRFLLNKMEESINNIENTIKSGKNNQVEISRNIKKIDEFLGHAEFELKQEERRRALEPNACPKCRTPMLATTFADVEVKRENLEDDSDRESTQSEDNLNPAKRPKLGEVMSRPSTSTARSGDRQSKHELLSEEHISLDDNVDSLESPVKSSSKKRETTRSIKNFALPKFSNAVQPLLDGDILSQNEHAQLSSILKEELISYLNRESLICKGNTSNLRWEYRDLGESLASKYPKMLWDLPSQRQTKHRKENAPIYAIFLRRLSQRRKMQRLRQKGKERRGIPFVVEVAENEVAVSPEDAVSELKSVTSEATKNGANIPRIKELLKISYLIRQKDDLSELPGFLMAQACLETEVELRLDASMAEMEKKVLDALMKMSAEYFVPETIIELEKMMQPKRAALSAITMGEYSLEMKRPGPSIFFGQVDKLLVTSNQVVRLEDTCTLERSTILLVGLYFILNLNYPSAYGQFLGLMQNIIVKGKKFPQQFSSNHLLKVTKKLI